LSRRAGTGALFQDLCRRIKLDYFMIEVDVQLQFISSRIDDFFLELSNQSSLIQNWKMKLDSLENTLVPYQRIRCTCHRRSKVLRKGNHQLPAHKSNVPTKELHLLRLTTMVLALCQSGNLSTSTMSEW
jgi:hypothetical protein